MSKSLCLDKFVKYIYSENFQLILYKIIILLVSDFIIILFCYLLYRFEVNSSRKIYLVVQKDGEKCIFFLLGNMFVLYIWYNGFEVVQVLWIIVILCL